MDEKAIKTIEELQIDQDALQRLIDYINEGIAILVEQVKEVANFISGILPDLIEICQNEIDKRDTERRKRKIAKQIKPRPLFLDKRSKIHRCRNAC